jgi:TolB protein
MRLSGVRSAAGVLSALAALLITACSEGPGSPNPPAAMVRLSVQTSGGDPDVDGFDAVIDGVRRQHVFAGMTVRIGGLTPGAHRISLERVAENCAVTGTGTQSLEVAAGDSVDVVFEVVCVGTGISITTRTTGTTHPPSYQLVTNGAPMSLPVNAVTVLGRLQPGPYTLELRIFGDHCTVDAGTNQIVVDVRAREVAPAVFDVTCGEPTRRPKVAFVVDSVIGNTQSKWIGLVNLDGSGHVRLALGSAPGWSPDGTTLTYSDANCRPYDYFYWSCGGGVVLVDPEISTTVRQPDGSNGADPAWAPTGELLAIVRCCEFFGPAISLLAVDGKASARRITLPAVSLAENPAWSPDGTRLAFTCALNPSNHDVCIVDRDGNDFRRLTTDPAVERDPAWSPEGSRIAFSSGEQIVVMTVEDRTVAALTRGFTPAWSPDGTRLVFARDDGLFIVNADGTGVRRLTTGRHSAPAWRP